MAVKTSEMKGGGEGVYASVPMPTGTLVAVFNGYRVPMASGHGDPAQGLTSEEERYHRLAYNIHMPTDADFFIDFPPDQADLTTYCASLGHKVNHSFLAKSVFGVMSHPRYELTTIICAHHYPMVPGGAE